MRRQELVLWYLGRSSWLAEHLMKVAERQRSDHKES